jgi:hypothetical protein
MTVLLPYNHDKTIKDIKPLIQIQTDSFARDFDYHLQRKDCDEDEIGYFTKLIQRLRLQK